MTDTEIIITPRQAEILRWILEKFFDDFMLPSTRELQKAFGFASQTAAISVLNALERKGLLVNQADKARARVPNWDAVLTNYEQIWTDRKVHPYTFVDSTGEEVTVFAPHSYVVAMYCMQQHLPIPFLRDDPKG
jgi:SOS-response transcriptional repressor LexA